MVRGLLNAVHNLDMSGFASNYYIPLKASPLSKITPGYACARENPFTDKVNQKQEYDKITRMMKYQTSQLLKTDFGMRLLATFNTPKNTEDLSRFYPKQQVEFVRDLMLSSK